MSRPSIGSVLRERGLVGLCAAVARRLTGRSRRAGEPILSVPVVSRDVNGVDVVGFFTAEHGVGDAARLLVTTMRAAGIGVSTVNYTDTESRMQHMFVTDDVSRYRTLFLSINADHLTVARRRFPDDFFRDRHVIGQWFWELETAPSWYEPAWPLVNELWAPTRFIESMLKRSAPPHVEIRHVPLPVVQPRIDDAITRTQMGIDGRYMFLFVFDLMSIMKRKNPLGLISAYTRAFAERDGAQLVIKTMNGDKRPDDLALLTAAAEGRADIIVIDDYFTRVQTSSLIALSDCYVSMHRSEGLGLTLSEAMSHGVPVIATNYSGNTDFMTEHNSFLLPWTRVPVGEGAGGYDPMSTWAEPDEDAALRAMRFAFENQLEARARGARGRDDILGGFSERASGAIMKSRLEEIWRSQGG